MNGIASAKATNESVGKPGQTGRSVEAARVDGEEQEREDEREDDVRRLPRRPDDGAPGKQQNLIPEDPAHAASAASPSSSSGSSWLAPSSERPVLARNTSSSDGW